MADNGDKLRLILGLCYLNSFNSVPQFKYEDIRTIKKNVFFEVDIKSGLHHTNILDEYQKKNSASLGRW